MDIIPEFNEDGSPKPIVLVGKNGTGKTLLLNTLVDSFIEFKRKKYQTLPEVNSNNYYKKGSKTYINAEKIESMIEILFFNEDKTFEYLELNTKDIEYTTKKLSDHKHAQSILLDSVFKEHGFYKSTLGENIQNELDDNIILYFPVSRYYVPAWYNKDNQPLGFKLIENSIGHDQNSIIKENVLQEIEHWFLDVLLDIYLYETSSRKVQIYEDGRLRVGEEQIIQEGKNNKLRNLINNLLSIIYRKKDKNIISARIGVSKKKGRRIGILVMYEDGNELEVASSFSHLSSGEAMLISLFSSILKSYDNLQTVTELHQVKGIVIIDEIDLNLHIEFAKEVIPKLISDFPNVQFIITTHSPFLLLGMEEHFKEKWQLINLPDGEALTVEKFKEVETAYQIFTEGYESLRSDFEEYKSRISRENRTLIITEGKTDWKHLKKAYERIKSENDEFTSLDIVFLEYDETTLKMSDSQLHSLLKELAKVDNNKKIIGLFDSDEANGKKYSKDRINILGNNIFAISLPKPNFRKDLEGISIELMYRDEDLKTKDSEGRRLFLTSEFSIDSGRHLEDSELSYASDVSKLKSTKIIDDKVYDSSHRNVALSKNQFADYILNNCESFDNFDISSFVEVFKMIEEIENSNNKPV